jgi:hypothetical protein
VANRKLPFSDYHGFREVIRHCGPSRPQEARPGRSEPSCAPPQGDGKPPRRVASSASPNRKAKRGPEAERRCMKRKGPSDVIDGAPHRGESWGDEVVADVGWFTGDGGMRSVRSTEGNAWLSLAGWHDDSRLLDHRWASALREAGRL